MGNKVGSLSGRPIKPGQNSKLSKDDLNKNEPYTQVTQPLAQPSTPPFKPKPRPKSRTKPFAPQVAEVEPATIITVTDEKQMDTVVVNAPPTTTSLSNISCPHNWNIKPSFSTTQGWSWGEHHQEALFKVAEEYQCPLDIALMMQSYVSTSAITICKEYTDQLLFAFNAGNRATKWGVNPRNPLNILILGAKKVGKTNLVYRFYVNAFVKMNQLEGLSTETTRCRVDVDLENEVSQRLYLRLYDTVGFNTITGRFKRNIVKEAHCILLVFDVSNEKTFEWFAAWNIIDQLSKIRANEWDTSGTTLDNENTVDARQLPLVLVGSKIDEIDNNIDDAKRKGRTQMADFSHVSDRVVPVEKIKREYCIPYHAPYVEVSSKCCTNVEQLFQIAAKEAMLYVANKNCFVK